MSRRAARDPYARRLLEGKRDAARYADLCVEFVDERDQSLLLRVGGRWDRKRKGWSDVEPQSALQIRVHPGQLEAVAWFRTWLEAALAGRELSPAIYSALLIGGSRAGKTYIGIAFAIAFAVAVPGARVWGVQEADVDRVDEIASELDDVLPGAWFIRRGQRYKAAHGSMITIRSAMHPAKLKRGRCDFAFMNEGQNIKRAAFDLLRMRTSDTSGLVLVAANPPNDDPDGAWIGDWVDDAAMGKRENSVAFHFHYRDNPHVNHAQLDALRQETDQRTWDIEVEGKMMPPANAVLHAFSTANISPAPDLPRGLDVTEEFLRRRGLGAHLTHAVGLDFQRAPHMAAIIDRYYRNAFDETRPLIYSVAEILVELGDEHDLSDGLFNYGLDPAHTVLIADASGEWQDADRTKGGSSCDILRSCGWRRIFKPDPNSDKNPLVHERMKNDNRLLSAADGTVTWFVAPECERLIEACKKYQMKSGSPHRRSEFAHIWDAASYVNWRMYPRRSGPGKVEYKRLKGRERPGELRKL